MNRQLNFSSNTSESTPDQEVKRPSVPINSCLFFVFGDSNIAEHRTPQQPKTMFHLSLSRRSQSPL
jgi:hypothetical protein